MRDTNYLPSGEYIIVDPCYVMPDKAYQDMIDTIYGTTHMEENEYTYKGKKMIVYGTAYGDGGYSNSANNNEILVDSGQIAIIPTDVLSKKAVKENAKHAVIITFNDLVICHNDGGNMTFGHVEVDTKQDDEEEEEDDDWFEEDDEDEDDYY